MKTTHPRPTSLLNLNKIKLYCILNNIQKWYDVPSCFNCQHRTICKTFSRDTSLNQVYGHSRSSVRRKNSIRFSYDKSVKNFQLGWKLQYEDYGCDKWKKN